MNEFLVKRPGLTCAVFTALAAFAGYNAFQARVNYGKLRWAAARPHRRHRPEVTVNEFLVKHPGLTCAVFTALAAFAGYNAFQAGVNYGKLRWAAAESARLVNEQLGG